MFSNADAAADNLEPKRTRVDADRWRSAISVLTPRPRAASGWPGAHSRIVRLVDDEAPDPERDAKVAELFRSLPPELSDADRRILFTLAHSGPSSQRALARELEMDRAYLSRRLRKLSDLRLVAHGARGWCVC